MVGLGLSDAARVDDFTVKKASTTELAVDVLLKHFEFDVCLDVAFGKFVADSQLDR